MRELVALAVLCLVVVFACFACFIWAVLRGQMLGLDDLLLVLICLALGGIFALNLVWLILKTPLRQALGDSLGRLSKFRPRAFWRRSRAAGADVSDGEHSKPSAL